MLPPGQRGGNAAPSPVRRYLLVVHAERVSTFELFFDLVFVFTITQLTSALHADSSPAGVSRVLLMLAVIWWMYGGYAWLTNAVSAEIGRSRLALLVGMIGFLIVSLAIPTAFTTGGVLFGLGYLLVVLVHATLFAQAGEGAIRGMRVVAPRNVVAALVLTLAGVLATRTGAAVGLVLWVAAVLVLWLPQRRSTERGFEIRPAHFVERHGLVIIIALGESVIAVATGTSTHPLSAGRVGIATLGVLLSVGLWWVYFDRDDSAAVVALERTPAAERPLKVKVGYGYWHYVLLLGIIAAAAGMKDAVSAPFHHLHFPASIALAAGVALYLGGHAGFRHTIFEERWSARLLWTALAALCTVPLGVHGTAAIQLAALVLVVSVPALRGSSTSRA